MENATKWWQKKRGKRMNKVLELMKMTDEGFFDQYLADASLEELAAFMKKFPEFLETEEKPEPDPELLKMIWHEIHQKELQE